MSQNKKSKAKPRSRRKTPLGSLLKSWWCEHYTDFEGHAGWILMEEMADGQVRTSAQGGQVPELADVLYSGALAYGLAIPFDAKKTADQMKLRESKRAAAAQLGQVCCQRDGHQYLGDVVGASYDVKGDLRLQVKHFNGEPWPFDPLVQEVEALR